jgi:inner membrane protein involved in colicin E2 resistance
MEAWGSQFVLYGPVIRIPVVEREEVRTKTEKEGEKVEIIMRNHALWITPKDIVIRADFSTQKKRRGIFSVALFSGDVSLSGNFTFERVKGELKQKQTLYPEQAEIIVGLASQKGIRRIIKADWNGSELFFKPGNRNYSVGYSDNNGINASSPFDTAGINTLFFLEVFSRRSIHPAQYLLSGLANIIFYLLLLSISEHLSFSLAYLIAAVALTGMMTLYARSLLETWTRSAYMGLVMALLYLILYLTLNAEDWALLIGSIVAFVITGVVMFLTRKLDWSSLIIKQGYDP